MEGIFKKKKKLRLWYVMGIVSGAALVGLFAFIFWKEGFDSVDIDTVVLGLFFIAFGAGVALFSAWLLAGELHSYLSANEQGIDGVDMYGRKLCCPLSDVKSVLAGGDSLSITRTDGKRFHFHQLENAAALYRWLVKHTTANREALLESVTDQECVRHRLLAIRGEQRQNTKRMIRCFVLMIALLALAILLVGNRDMKDFSLRDWCVFSVLFVPGFIAMVRMLVSMMRNLRLSEELQLKVSAYSKIVMHKVAGRQNQIVRVYLDDEEAPNYRLVVYRLPQEQGFYFTVEALNNYYELEILKKSAIYDEISALEDVLRYDVDELVQIQ